MGAPVQPDKYKGFAIAALILGIASIVLCCTGINVLTGIAAIVFGILGLKSRSRGMAIAGLVLGGICLLMTIIGIIFMFTASGQEFFREFSREFFNDFVNDSYYW